MSGVLSTALDSVVAAAQSFFRHVTFVRRVPDELKKHSLSDGVGGQYSTNLDRNRYGADDQYLSTVIRYDLEYLRLCPCLVDVEIIDAKNGSGTILVSAGPEYCLCNRDAAQVN